MELAGRNVRIGVVSNFRGGLKEFTTSLSRGLQAHGFDVELLCPVQLGSPSSTKLVQEPAIHYGLSALVRIFSGRFDLLHCNIASLSLPLVVRKKIAKIPLVETFHGLPQWWLEHKVADKVAYAMEYGAVRKLANYASSRTSVSNFVRSGLLDVFDLDSQVIYNGISRCQTLFPDRSNARKQFDLDDETVALLFVGRLHPAKDPITLLRAFDIVVKKRKKVKLLVVGDGPLVGTFRREVVDRHLEGFVSTWKYLPSLHPVFSAADIFCLPSVNEAFGIVLLEAMDHSLPLVVSDSGAAIEVAGSGGISFRTGDAFDLSSKLSRLVDEPRMRRALGRESDSRFENHFRLDTMVASYVRVYDELQAV